MNDAAGQVILSPVVYDHPGIYHYTLSEAKGEGGFGVSYDERVYAVTTVVSDQGDGTLKAEHQMKGDGVVFENQYQPSKTDIQPGAFKVLKGRALKEGEFTFQLKDQAGQVISEAWNQADGTVRFDRIELDKAGEKVYTISEVKGRDRSVVYDETVYTIKVTVTDDLKGHLSASLDTGDQTPVFSNSVKEDKKDPGQPVPQKSDRPSGNAMTGLNQKPFMMVVGILCLAAAVLMVLWFIRRRKHE